MKKPSFKQTLVAGATVATLGLGLAGAGIASADSAAANGQTSLIDKLATTFNLNKDQVAAVFQQDRQDHLAQEQQNRAQRLAQAVTDGKLTQAQADHITAAQKDIESLMSQSEPGQEDDATRTSIRQKMDELRTWAQDNNVDLQYAGPMGHGGPGGPDGNGGTPPADSVTNN